MSLADALELGVASGDEVRLQTQAASVLAVVEVTERMRKGHLSLPNGVGLSNKADGGVPVQVGIAPNELTLSSSCDGFAGTPWHKCVPARVKAV